MSMWTTLGYELIKHTSYKPIYIYRNSVGNIVTTQYTYAHKIWNEREYTNDANCTYIKKLRAELDKLGLHHTQIVAADGGWDIVNNLYTDKTLFEDVSIVGVHYPGTNR